MGERTARRPDQKASATSALPIRPGRVLSLLRRWPLARSWPRARWGVLAEAGLIVLWAAWVGRAYLNLARNVWPWGAEFGMSIHSHYVWSLLSRCGTCMLWNGFVNGGTPAFIDLHGAALHPLVIASTLLWGVINGAKISLVAALAMAGLAQWWLARVLGLGLAPRLWSGALAVVGGHLAGRMELGLFGLLLSTAAASLVIPAGLELALTRRPRAIVALGVTLALALVAGQGYLQLGLLLGLCPAFCVFLVDGRLRLRPAWKDFALAGALAILLGGVFLVPLAHFWPNLGKDLDAGFNSAQSLEYLPLNLVIREYDFFRSTVLSKTVYPFLYLNYVGWVPVLLALLALWLVPRSRARVLAFFVLAIGLVYLASSGLPFRWLARLWPVFAAGVRNPSLLAGLAVPLVIGLAAWGLDRLLRQNWPVLALTGADGSAPASLLRLRASWLVLLLPLLWSLKSAYDFGQPWLRTVNLHEGMYRLIESLRPETTAWVLPPYGEHVWPPLAFDAGLKTTQTVRPWHWKERKPPPPALEAIRGPVDIPGATLLGELDGISLVARPGNEYARVEAGSQCILCRAEASGGNIDVDCETEVAGTLVVQENQWSGWRASRDGAPATLGAGPWLSVAAPPGRHHYEFRYRPWDVLLGLLLTLVGVSLAVGLWLRRPAPDDGAAAAGD